ncbi:MAG TPA: DUF4915 domain-containing protein, partial [Bacteroidetes bacterium]|nr:DUF4915 domain-containing protein [Bacteroidota bacterium]
HINDLELYKDKLYISAISKSGNFYNDFLDGVIYELDYQNSNTLVPVLEGLLFQHAIKKFNDTLIFLNSFNGDVLNIANENIVNLPGFIRGLDCQGDLLYIGQSRHRRLEKAKKYFNGISMESGIYVVDIETKMYKFILMPEMCDIFAIQIIENFDNNE